MTITDWDDAYANRDHVPDAPAILEALPRDAQAFRDRMSAQGRARLGVAYGAGARQLYDLFLPEAESPKGLVVFVHGGYWRLFDRTYWSHYATGALAHGWAVAMVQYTLCPEASIAGIGTEVAAGIAAAAGEVPGPIRLAGHSAGGHLVTRAMCSDSALPESVAARVAHTLSISGVHDLRPLIRTAMNEDLKLTLESAAAESPALLLPRNGARVTAWVGDIERPEFVRQSTLLANIWTGLGADMAQVKAPGRHHFDVIDGLLDPDSQMMRTLLG
ncbi:alpha/beta hydrolase [Oceanibium sediminis]|uniref:alpha/beta hydrolase n=1 Tax=Oceanibium sediminis TaxID=2026339 RepID=UPI000DD2DA88|nr:alpha/beta hydrolase [Oceanibium sediminis]